MHVDQYGQQQVYQVVRDCALGMSGSVDPSEVRIKLKHGDWEVEVTCDEKKVKDVVERVLSSLDSRATNMVSNFENEIADLRREINLVKGSLFSQRLSGSSPQERLPKTGMTCRGLIETIWMESFFASERPLGEVHDELARRGYNYDRTGVSHSLSDLVREGLLSRVGTMRNYRYIQKRPPNAAPSERQPLSS